MKKKISLLGICIMLIFVMSSCTKKVNQSELVYVHSWTAEGLGGHFYSGADQGPASWYVVEGFGDYLRTLDHVYYTTASEITHGKDSTSIVKIKDNIYWQESQEKFCAKDVLSFYYLNTPQITSYLTKIEEIDETTVKFYWKESIEPADTVKTLLLVTDRVASAPYYVFKEFADKAIQLYNSSKSSGEKEITFFGKQVTPEDSIELSKNYSAYQKFQPEIYPATGPYCISAINANEMILTKNENWYDKKNVGFTSIRCINSVGDASLYSSMLINGSIDLWLNTPSKPTVDNILKSNSNIAFYKVPSPYTHGVKFNMQKQTTLWTPKVREAFQYIFDRDEVRKLSCFYANTTWSAMSGMSSTDKIKWMSKDAFDSLPSYTYDLTRAETLLKESGWSRKSGKWYDSSGKLVELVIGYDGANTVPSSVAEAIQAQLTNFGIVSNLKRASSYGEFYALATQENGPYDLVCDNTSYNSSFSYPSACFQEVYNSGVGATGNIKFLKEEYLTGFQGQTFKPIDYIDKMLTLKEEELTMAVNNLVIGLTNMNVGIDMFQESSGGLYNMAKIDGLPFPQKLAENRDIQYIPEVGSKDHIDLLYTILFYDHGSALTNGRLYPKETTE